MLLPFPKTFEICTSMGSFDCWTRKVKTFVFFFTRTVLLYLCAFWIRHCGLDKVGLFGRMRRLSNTVGRVLLAGSPSLDYLSPRLTVKK